MSVAVAQAMLERYSEARATALDARTIAESHGHTQIVERVESLIRNLPTTDLAEESGETMDPGEQLYRSALEAVPYLRRDGVGRYAAATGGMPADLLEEAEKGVALLNEVLEGGDDDELREKYSLIFLSSLRRVAERSPRPPAISPLAALRTPRVSRRPSSA